MEKKNENNLITKAGNFLRKLFNFRLKVSRKEKTIVNVSSLFAAACLIFAPRMTLAGIVLSLILGYQIRFENEQDDADLAREVRNAAQNVKEAAVNAAKSLQTEINKVRAESKASDADSGAGKATEKAQEPAASNEDLLRDLEEHADETPQSNPAATTFHSAYAASAGTVPVLELHENGEADNVEPDVPKARTGE